MIEHASMASKAMGGTELMAHRLANNIDPKLLDQCQIWLSRYDPEKVDPTKYQILYTHDLAQDPASRILQAGGHMRFHAIIFVSYWQKQQFQNYYDIPPSKCYVLRNAIEPLPAYRREDDDKIRLGYWSTPHRGLEILVPVFEQLAKEFDNIELDVFSSFDLYGWPERDAPYKVLFDRCRAHPKINYHGSVDNDTIRKYAVNADILAYPCIWQETSCLVLIEAIAAGMVCVHPDLAALPETASNQTVMYRYHEDPMKHAERFYEILRSVILSHQRIGVDYGELRAERQQAYIGDYNWDVREAQWEATLEEITSADL